MTADSEEDFRALKTIGHICADTLRKMIAAVRPGMTTHELDERGRALLEAAGARSAPQPAYAYPGATCISVAPVIAHGIPDDHALQDGELIHIDVSAELDGYFADTGASVWVSGSKAGASVRPSAEVRRLLEATRAALSKALTTARAGNRLNGIGKSIQQEANKRGYNVIYELTGHGIGHGPHHGGRRRLVLAHGRQRPGCAVRTHHHRDQGRSHYSHLVKHGAASTVEPGSGR